MFHQRIARVSALGDLARAAAAIVLCLITGEVLAVEVRIDLSAADSSILKTSLLEEQMPDECPVEATDEVAQIATAR